MMSNALSSRAPGCFEYRKLLLLILLLSVLLDAHAQTSLTTCDEAPSAIQIAAELRNLPNLGKIWCRLVEKEEYQKLVETMKSDSARLRYEEIVYKILGLIPDDYDYEKCVNSDSIDSVLASYYPKLKSIVAPAWKPIDESTLIHESAHAVQDSFFNLGKYERYRLSSSDQKLAIDALIEGDALVVEQKFGKSSLESESTRLPTGCELPPSLDLLFNFPYDFGPIFINILLSEGGYALVNSAFRRTPQATEEVLYPKKYLSGQTAFERLSIPRLTSPSASDYKLRFSDVMGEYFIRVLLKRWIKSEEAILAAKGWGGDRIALYEKRDSQQFMVAWDIRWDSENEAAEFYRALLRALSNRFQLILHEASSMIVATLPHQFELSISNSSKLVKLRIGLS